MLIKFYLRGYLRLFPEVFFEHYPDGISHFKKQIAE